MADLNARMKMHMSDREKVQDFINRLRESLVLGESNGMSTEDKINLRKRILDETAKLRQIVKHINRLKTMSRKSGTILPFSPFKTPTFYRTRGALRHRVQRGYRDRAASLRGQYDVSKLRPSASNYGTLKEQYEQSLKNIDDSTDLAYRDWDSQNIPLWKLRVSGKSRKSRRPKSKRRRASRRRTYF